MKNYKNTGGGLRTFLISVTLNLLSIILTVALTSFLCYTTKKPLANAKLFSLAAIIISGAVCGFVNSKRKSGSVGISVFASAFIGCVIIIISVFAKAASLPATLMNVLCFMLPSCATAILGKGKTVKRKRRT